MKWAQPKTPHVIYEALTAIADGDRIELVGDNGARLYSTSRNKFYEIEYKPDTQSIMSNDNMAYYTGTLSYPMVAFLMLKGLLPYPVALLEPLKGIPWKDINQRHKNDFMASVTEVLEGLADKGVDTSLLQAEIQKLYAAACRLELNYLGEKRRPPRAY